MWVYIRYIIRNVVLSYKCVFSMKLPKITKNINGTLAEKLFMFDKDMNVICERLSFKRKFKFRDIQ